MITKCCISEGIQLQDAHIYEQNLWVKTHHNLVLCGRGDTAVIKVIPLSIHFIFAISCVCQDKGKASVNKQLFRPFVYPGRDRNLIRLVLCEWTEQIRKNNIDSESTENKDVWGTLPYCNVTVYSVHGDTVVFQQTICWHVWRLNKLCWHKNQRVAENTTVYC